MKGDTMVPLLILMMVSGPQASAMNSIKLKDLNYYEVVDVTPSVEKRNVEESDDKHRHFSFKGYSQEFDVTLKRNDNLLPATFSTYIQTDGKKDTYKEDATSLENCFYHGEVKDQSDSWVAGSTCNDELHMEIKDQNHEHFSLKPHPDEPGKHVLYRKRDIKNKEQGDIKEGIMDVIMRSSTEQMEIRKYSANDIPFEQDKYLEIMVAVGKNTYDSLIDDTKYPRSGYRQNIELYARDLFPKAKLGAKTADEKIKQYIAYVVNAAGLVFKPVNLKCVLSKLVIWKHKNPIKTGLSIKISDVLSNFNSWQKSKMTRKVIGEDFDVAYLMCRNCKKKSRSSGMAYLGSICSNGATAMGSLGGDNYYLDLNTMTHEFGHVIGLNHSSGGIMGISKYSFMPLNKENIQVLAPLLRKAACLVDKPCGDGIINGDEECDCGSYLECKENGGLECCEGCKLKSQAKCSHGPYCTKCQLKDGYECGDGPCCHEGKLTKGNICRDAEPNGCDVPNMCMGKSPLCIDNGFRKQDGEPCKYNGIHDSHCYQKKCAGTLDAQCKQRFGSTATFEKGCEKMNGAGDGYSYKGCEYFADSFSGCQKQQDELCGYLQCLQASSDTWAWTINSSYWNKFSCQYKIAFDWDYNYDLYGEKKVCPNWRRISYAVRKKGGCKVGLTDPGVADVGTKCGDGKMCWHELNKSVKWGNNVWQANVYSCKKISSLDSIKQCKEPCENGGSCNNKGNCHCPPGFAPPFCRFPGKGGSVDTGAVLVTGEIKVHPCDKPTKGGCSDICERKGEGYNCKCTNHKTHELDSTGKVCVKIHPCDKPTKGGCSDICERKGEGYNCKCTNHKTHELDSTGKVCVKIHPCDKPTKGGCSDICERKGEGYNCKCTNHKTHELDSTGKVCVKITLVREYMLLNAQQSWNCEDTKHQTKCGAKLAIDGDLSTSSAARYELVAKKAECHGGEYYIEKSPSVAACAEACFEKAYMFAFGTNEFGNNRCSPDGNCRCLCEYGAANGVCFNQVEHTGYNLYAYKKATKNHGDGWWQAEVKERIKVDRIVLYLSEWESRMGAYKYLKVQTRDSPEGVWVDCLPVADVKEHGSTPYVLRCTNKNTIAKYIKVSNRNPNKDWDWGLNLAEVKVFGVPTKIKAVADFNQDTLAGIVEDLL